MNNISFDMFAEMQAEDPWLKTDTAALSLVFAHSIKYIPFGIESFIETCEFESVHYPESPALSCLLASCYSQLDKELSLETKLQIEKHKLNLAGKGYLITPLENPKVNVKECCPTSGIHLATDIAHLMGTRSYLQFNNLKRSYSHLHDSLKRSSDNPIIFKHLIDPLAKIKMVPLICAKLEKQAVHGADCYRTESFDLNLLSGMTSQIYEDAKARVYKQ